MLRSLPLAVAVLTLALPTGAQAITTPFPVGTNWILSGTDTLDAGAATPANDSSLGNESVSADGRYVVFSSYSDGLSSEDDDRSSQVYVKDRQTGALTLVSRRSGSAGTVATGFCNDPAISADGTRVAFVCPNPLTDADTNNDRDVYLRDWQAAEPTTTLVSRAPGLGAVFDFESTSPSLSADGEYVVFQTRSAIDGVVDTNDKIDVYRRRIGGGDPVVLVSRKWPAGAVGDQESRSASISDAGTRVVFETESTNLLAAPTTHRNIYMAEPDAGTIALVSAPTNVVAEPNGDSHNSAISGDGAFVAFTSSASDLQDGDAETGFDVHKRQLASNQTTLVSTLAQAGDANGSAIDTDGSVVGFTFQASSATLHNAYVRDGADIVLVSQPDGDGGDPLIRGDGASGVALSGDGAVTAFGVGPGGPGLTPDADAGLWNVFARDRSVPPSTTRLISRPAGSDPFVNTGGQAELSSSDRAISADGRRVAFRRLLGGSTQLVVRDTTTGALVVAGRADGAEGLIDRQPSFLAISADGTRVAWATDTALDPVTDTNGLSDIYVRDLAANRTWLASRADGAAGAVGGNGSYSPILDADGSRVAFFSYAQNLGDGDVSANSDMHVRDLATDRTLLASSKDGPPATGNGGVDGRPAISADGTKVAFRTSASDLGDGDADAGYDIHLRDLVAETTRQVSSTPGGVSGDGASGNPSISADGTRVAFSSTATNLIEDFAGVDNVYVRDLAANTIAMPGRASGEAGAPAALGTFSVRLSLDGRFLLFGTGAQNIGFTFTGFQTFLRDLTTHETVLASVGADGQPIAAFIEGASISADAACLAFTTDATAISGPVTPDFPQAYLRALRPGCVASPAGPAEQPGPGTGTPPVETPAATDTAAPVITEARLSRARFRVGARAMALIATKAGTRLRLRASEAARLTITVQRARPGRRSGKRCLVVTKPVARRACVAWARDGKLIRTLTRAGVHRFAFSGRIGARRLARGRHRLVLRAVDAAGNRSKPVRLGVRIVRR